MSTPITTISGIASGLQWKDLVDQIISIESKRTLAPLQKKATEAQSRQQAWDALIGKLNAVRDAVAPLKSGSPFRANSVLTSQSPSGGRSLLTAAGTGTIVPGTYAVKVSALATAERLGGLVAADANAALGASGAFTVNGRAITGAASDSLATVRDKINAANTGTTPSGVTATVVTSGGTSRLMLSADQVGAEGVQLAEVRAASGDPRVLQQLGLVDDSISAANVGSDGRTASTAMSSATKVIAAALGVQMSPPPATIVVNGQAIRVDLSAQSLVDVVALINAKSPGAASVVTTTRGGATWQQLRIQGTVAVDPADAANSRLNLEALGLFTGGRGASAQVVRTGNALNDAVGAVATRATLLTDLGSNGISSANLAVGDQVVLTGFKRDGVTRVNLTHTVAAGETLGTLVDAITAAFGGGATAAVDAQGHITLTDAVTGESQLAMSLTAGQAAGTLDFGGSVTTRGLTRTLAAGGDAVVDIDGQRVTSSTNQLVDAIPGVTLNLTAADPATTVSVEVSATPDAAVASVQSLAAAFNDARAFVDVETGAGGRLASSGAARAAFNSVKEFLLADVAGLAADAPYKRAGAVGLALQKDGTLKLDADAFKAALKAAPAAVQALFATAGSSDVSGLQYIAGGTSTTAGAHPVVISRAATQATFAGAVLGSYASTGTDQMTITDTFTGRRGSISLAGGDTVDAIAAKLNTLFAGQGMGLTAAADGGRLRITATAYGSAGGFTVAYTPGTDDKTATLGIPAGSYAGGLDVAGTIDGVTATGTGQVLTAADGLTVRHMTGALVSGVITYSPGLAGLIARMADGLTKSDGPLAKQSTSLANSITALTARQEAAQARLETRRESLSRQFAAMETAIAKWQAQGSWLSGQVTALRNMMSSAQP